MQMMHISHVNSKIGLVTMQPKLYYATNLIYHSSAWQFFRLLGHARCQFFPTFLFLLQCEKSKSERYPFANEGTLHMTSGIHTHSLRLVLTEGSREPGIHKFDVGFLHDKFLHLPLTIQDTLLQMEWNNNNSYCFCKRWCAHNGHRRKYSRLR